MPAIQPTHTPQLLTIQEVAEFLRVSVNTVYYWARYSKIPYVRVGKHLRFDKVKVLEFFEKSSCPDTGPFPCPPRQSALGLEAIDGSLKTESRALLNPLGKG